MNIGMNWAGHKRVCKTLIFKLIGSPKFVPMTRKMN